jgi:hypothetical protein
MPLALRYGRAAREQLSKPHEHWRCGVAQKHIGGRFWRPPIVLPVTLLAYFFFAVFLAAFFAGFFATAFLVAIFPILPLSSRHRTCKRYFAVNECIESQKNSVKKKIAFGEDQLINRNR